MPGQHAVLSASGASRWMACPPSARLEEQFPESQSPYAEEGTLAHSLCDLLLRKQFTVMKPSAYKRELKKIQANDFYCQAMMDHCEDYRDFVVEMYHASPGSIIASELKVDFSAYVPEGYGTCDCVIIADDVMRVIDMKYGQGVPVSAVNNPQLMLYALGAYLEYELIYNIKSIQMTIYQPRLDSISTFDVYVDDLLAWAEQIKPVAQEAFDGDGEFFAGDHCRWCRAKAVCRARAEKNLELAKHDFAKPQTLSDEELADVLKAAEELSSWAKDVAEYALAQVRDHGKQYAGWKLVEGRSNRIYKDQDAVMETLLLSGFDRAIITETNLLGITKMEKAIGKKKFSELLAGLIDKPAGKPTLVPESDKRPEIQSEASAIEDFKEE